MTRMQRYDTAVARKCFNCYARTHIEYQWFVTSPISLQIHAIVTSTVGMTVDGIVSCWCLLGKQKSWWPLDCTVLTLSRCSHEISSIAVTVCNSSRRLYKWVNYRVIIASPADKLEAWKQDCKSSILYATKWREVYLAHLPKLRNRNIAIELAFSESDIWCCNNHVLPEQSHMLHGIRLWNFCKWRRAISFQSRTGRHCIHSRAGTLIF